MKSLPLFCALLMAMPDRPMLEEKPKAPPNLSGMTNWGRITQEGCIFTIDGNPHWYAAGRIRADGKIELLWIHREGNRPALGVYSLLGDGATLKGVWGCDGDVTVGADGELTGETRQDTIYRVQAD